jgi:molecular chaperone DnaJ
VAGATGSERGVAKRDYYEVLSVQKTATEQEIKSSYRKLAHKYHPDKNPGDHTAEESFKEVSEAYEVLSNPEKRARYDQFGHNFERAGGGGDPYGGNVSDIFVDIFGDMFGGGGRRQRGGGAGRGRGNDLRVNLELSFEEAVFGTETTIRIPRHKRCDECDGSGAKKGTKPKTCPTCGGQGEVRLTQGFFSVARTCHQCHGAGQIIADPCGVCRGQGRTEYEAAVRVRIPAGVDTGVRIRQPGEGDVGEQGGGPGDLHVVVSVREHPLFTRQDADIICELPVSFTQAALGAKVVVPTLDGKVEFPVPAGTQSGKVFRLRNKGVPHLSGGGRGDQYVHVTVEVPRHLTKKQKDLLEQLSDTMGETQTPKSKSFIDKVKEVFGGEPARERMDVPDEPTGS